MNDMLHVVTDQIVLKLQMVAQSQARYDWLPRAGEYFHELQALVEAVEVYDCGSVGGFCPTQLRVNPKGRP